jgi:hypothetical protein
MELVNPLNEVLAQYARELDTLANTIFKVRVAIQKDLIEKSIVAQEAGENSDQYRDYYIDAMKRYVAADRWRGMAYSEEHFNWKFFDPEGAPAILRGWADIDWHDEDALEKIEDDCRTLSSIVMLYANGRLKEVLDDTEVYPAALHALCIDLHRLASLSLGYWIPAMITKVKRGYQR